MAIVRRALPRDPTPLVLRWCNNGQPKRSVETRLGLIISPVPTKGLKINQKQKPSYQAFFRRRNIGAVDLRAVGTIAVGLWFHLRSTLDAIWIGQCKINLVPKIRFGTQPRIGTR